MKIIAAVSLIIIFAIPAKAVSLPDNLIFSGYFENQLTSCYAGDTFKSMDYNKLRLTLTYKPSRSLYFRVDYALCTYHGHRKINISDYFPEYIDSSVIESYPVQDIELDETYDLQNAYFTYSFGRSSLTIGKQQLQWGTGYTWNPTDILHEKMETEPTYTVSGVDAVKYEIPIGINGIFNLITAYANGTEDPSFVIRARKTFFNFDFSLGFQHINSLDYDIETNSCFNIRNNYISFDFTGEIGNIGIWNETLIDLEDSENNKYLLGSDHTFLNGFYIIAEYIFIKNGSDDITPDDYFLRFIGKKQHINRNYLMIGCKYSFTELIQIIYSGIINLDDSSFISIPWVSIDLHPNLSIDIALNIFSGRDKSEYGPLPDSAFIRASLYF